MNWKWIAAGTLLAAVVFIASVWWGPSIKPAGPPQTQPQRADTPGPPGFASGAEGVSTGLDIASHVESVTNYYVRRVGSGGHISEFFGRKLQPQATGRSLVTGPVVRVYLARGRLIQITADQAELYAPDNQPQSGDLRGNVYVTLYEGRNEALDFNERSADLAARIAIDRPVHFDVLAGQIESDGPVRLSSRRVDMRGEGLVMRYSEMDSQIQLLQIDKGQELRLSREERAQAPASTQAGATLPSTRASASATAAADTRAPNVYRAVFEQLQEVRSGTLRVLGDQVELVFSLQSGAPGREALQELGQGRSGRQVTGLASLAHQPMVVPVVLCALAVGQVPTSPLTRAPVEELFEPAEDDVVMHWAGRLVVRPLEEGRQRWRPQDVLLKVVGQPLKVTSDEGQDITGASLEYLAPAGQVTVVGSPQHSLVLASPQGTLRAPRAVINTADCSGTVAGPGLLTLHAKRGQSATQPAGAAQMRWRDRLDLAFYGGGSQAEPKGALGDLGKLTGVRTATFVGDAAVHQERFDVRAQRLEVGLSDPAGGPQRVRRVVAEQGARASTASEGGQDEWRLQAQYLSLVMVDQSGQARPGTLEAKGEVEAQSGESVLRAGWLNVRFSPGDDAAGDREKPGRESPVSRANVLGQRASAVQWAEAGTDVEVRMADEGLTLRGDRLVVDNEARRMGLDGTPDRPAQAASTRGDRGTLSGQRLVFDGQQRTAEVPGPGTLALDVRPAGADAATRSGETLGVGQRPIAIDWHGSMHFDEAQQQAEFAGGVEMRSQDDGQSTRLSGGEMTLTLFDVPDGGRSVRTAELRRRVVFLSERRAVPGGAMLSRLRLAGEQMKFDGVLEQVQVDGAGTLLFEQHKPHQAVSAATQPAPRVRIGGPGATLFAWTGDLLLDANHNDMRMRGDVVMDHKPDGEGEGVHLDCQSLLADLEQTTGLKGWMSGQATPPRLMGVYADRRVRVVYGTRSVVAEQLRYAGSDQSVILRGAGAGPGGVRVYEGEQLSVDARSVRWDLANDKYEVIEPGAMRVPVGEQ